MFVTTTYIPLKSPSKQREERHRRSRFDQDILFQAVNQNLEDDFIVSVPKPAPKANEISIGVLTISTIRCRNIRSAQTQITRPYVAVTVGNQTQETRIDKRLSGEDLAFHEIFNFTVRNPLDQEIVFRVKEFSQFSTHKAIGELTIRFENFLASDVPLPIVREYVLQSEVECFISFRLNWVGSM